MKTQLIVALFAVLSATAAPAFASGYGPAPGYRPTVGAPASQRGQSVQTLAAEGADESAAQSAYGGSVVGRAEAGSPPPHRAARYAVRTSLSPCAGPGGAVTRKRY